MKRTQTIAAAAAATAALGLAACASAGGHTPLRHATAAAASPAAAAPTLTGPQTQWVSDAQAQFGFTNTSRADLIALGEDACTLRQSGHSQAATTRQIGQELTGGGNGAVVRLAEKDLCPAQVPVAHWHVLATYSGTGQWNSPPFKLHNGSHLKVVFFYSGNTLGGSASNFIADLVSSGDDLPIANDIAASGGKRISLYPDLGFGGTKWYHLEVQADGSWSFKIEQKY